MVPVENMDWIALIVGLCLGSGILAGLLATWRAWSPPATDDPEEIGEDEDLADKVTKLQGAVRLLQGRVNVLAPPRLGTGRNGGPEDTATATDGVRTRADIVRAFNRQRR